MFEKLKQDELKKQAEKLETHSADNHELRQFEWLLEKEVAVSRGHLEGYQPPYKDVTTLNTSRVILDAVGKNALWQMARDLMDLLDTSVAFYEENGDYAYGIFDSKWCQMFDSASFALCKTSDTKKALECGKWLCHENCWNDSAKAAIDAGKPTDIDCVGGIRLYAVPIRAGNKTIGAVNIGYGTPPQDDEALHKLAERFKLNIEDIRRASAQYKPRPQYIIDLAKRRCKFVAQLVGEIVERKRSENRLLESENGLKEAQRLANIGNWSWNLDTGELYMSDEMYHIVGLEKNAAALDVSQHEQCYTPETWQRFLDAVESVRQTRDPYEIELEMVRKKEPNRTAIARGEPIIDDQGRLVGLRGTLQDITERKRMEEQLQQLQKMEAIGTLAGGIAHDFNNILSSILGFTELALSDIEKDSTIEKSLQEVCRAGKRAKDLVWQILTFARQTNEPTKPIQIGIITKEVLKFIRSSIPTLIEIKHSIDSSSFVMGNKAQIDQIIMNLCTNAAQAMADSGGILEVTLKDVAIYQTSGLIKDGLTTGDYVEIKVSDTGPGISPDVIGSIFEPYFTTKAPGEGTGMGLSVVHGIVESYGGRIAVESKLGEGTTFRTYLPITNERQDEQSSETEDLPTGTERILFIDDEETIADVGSQILERLGYTVTALTNSIEALELFKSKPDDFDLVVSDMTMPIMTGDKLAAELMKIRPTIPVILCTGHSSKISDEKAREIGIKAFAHKPIVMADLAQMVRKVLDDMK